MGRRISNTFSNAFPDEGGRTCVVLLWTGTSADTGIWGKEGRLKIRVDYGMLFP